MMKSSSPRAESAEGQWQWEKLLSDYWVPDFAQDLCSAWAGVIFSIVQMVQLSLGKIKWPKFTWRGAAGTKAFCLFSTLYLFPL